MLLSCQHLMFIVQLLYFEYKYMVQLMYLWNVLKFIYTLIQMNSCTVGGWSFFEISVMYLPVRVFVCPV